MQLIKNIPCWMKVCTAILALLFLFNWPNTSGEWAAWVQAVGVISAVVAGFASSALDRRRAHLERTDFLISAVQDLIWFLETVEEAMEVRDPSTGLSVVSKPGGIPVEPLRSTLQIIEGFDMSGLPFKVVKGLRDAVATAHNYASAFEAKSETVEEALRNSFRIYDIHTPKQQAQSALSAIHQRRTEIQSRPLFSLD